MVTILLKKNTSQLTAKYLLSHRLLYPQLAASINKPQNKKPPIWEAFEIKDTFNAQVSYKICCGDTPQKQHSLLFLFVVFLLLFFFFIIILFA